MQITTDNNDNVDTKSIIHCTSDTKRQHAQKDRKRNFISVVTFN